MATKSIMPAAEASNPAKHNAKRKNLTCRLFVQGHCKYGDACKFLHASEETNSAVISAAKLQHSVSSSITDSTNTTLVPAAATSQSHDEQSTADNLNSRAKEICRLFISGHCKRGNNCRYRHDQEAAVILAAKPQHSVSSSLAELAGRTNTTLIPAAAASQSHDEQSTADNLNPRAKEICRLFISGHCKRGNNCKYRHDKGATNSPVISPAKLQHSDSSSIAVHAKHDTGMVSSPSAPLVPGAGKSQSHDEQSAANNLNSRAKELCRDFMSGHCKKGNNCRYRHDQEARTQQERRIAQSAREAAMRRAERERHEAALNARRTELLAQKAQKEASVTIQRVVLGSARVTIATGLDIIDMISGFDSCCIKIKHLPLDAKEHEIIGLFSQQGINPGLIFLKAVKVTHEHLEAEILTQADIGQVIIFALDGLEFRTEKLQCSVYENAAPDAMDTWNKADCKVLTISWRSQSVTMIADYDTEEEVQRAIRDKNKQMYFGKSIKVERNTRPPNVVAQSYYVPTSVKVSGLPFGVEEKSVQQFMGARSIRTLRSNVYSADVTESTLISKMAGCYERQCRSK